MGDHGLGGLGFAAGVDHGLPDRLRLANGVLELVALALVGEPGLAPEAVHHVQPLGRAAVAIVVLVELQAVAGGFLLPPGRDDIERKASAADLVDVGRLLGEQGGMVEVRPHRHHQFEFFGHGGQRGGGGPGVERRLVDALDVVEIEFGDEGEVIADLLGALAQAPGVLPGGRHALVGHIAQPAAEDGGPETVPHAAACRRPPISRSR